VQGFGAVDAGDEDLGGAGGLEFVGKKPLTPALSLKGRGSKRFFGV